jgi:hypothetical protein
MCPKPPQSGLLEETETALLGPYLPGAIPEGSDSTYVLVNMPKVTSHFVDLVAKNNNYFWGLIKPQSQSSRKQARE